MSFANELCCGYPLVDDQQWALRFYWLAREEDQRAVWTSVIRLRPLDRDSRSVRAPSS